MSFKLEISNMRGDLDSFSLTQKKSPKEAEKALIKLQAISEQMIQLLDYNKEGPCKLSPGEMVTVQHLMQQIKHLNDYFSNQSHIGIALRAIEELNK